MEKTGESKKNNTDCTRKGNIGNFRKVTKE